MASYKPLYGLKKIEIGTATVNNTAPVSLKEVPFTKMQTAVYANEADTMTPIPYEESTIPLITLKTATGARTLKWTTYTNDLSLMAQLEGGTFTAGTVGPPATGDSYSPPNVPVMVKAYIKFTNIQSGTVEFFNADISVVRNGLYSREGLPELEVTATAGTVDTGFQSIVETQPPVA